MSLERIKLNDTIFDCFTVNYSDGGFYAIIKSDALDAIENEFKNVNEITIMNNIGQIIKTVSGFEGIQNIAKLPDYYMDEENNKKPVIQITLKPIDVNAKFKAIEEKLNTTVNEAAMTLDEYKEYRINQSKVALEEYLDKNPITSNVHGGKEAVYSITKEKQDLMSQQYLTYQITKAVDPEHAILTWNERGGICEPWTEEEFVQLVMEIKAKVYPLVSYQQMLEKEIRESRDKEEIVKMVFNYNNAATVVNM